MLTLSQCPYQRVRTVVSNNFVLPLLRFRSPACSVHAHEKILYCRRTFIETKKRVPRIGVELRYRFRQSQICILQIKRLCRRQADELLVKHWTGQSGRWQTFGGKRFPTLAVVSGDECRRCRTISFHRIRTNMITKQNFVTRILGNAYKLVVAPTFLTNF